MTRRSNPGFGSRYKCPTCGKDTNSPDRVRYGPFFGHLKCDVTCGLCRQVIDPPPIGRQAMVQVWLNTPVHQACKVRRMNGPFEAGRSDLGPQ